MILTQMYSFSEYYSTDRLTGRLLVELHDLKTFLDDNLFILVGGSNKSYYINEVLQKVVGGISIYKESGIFEKLYSEKEQILPLPDIFKQNKSFIYTGNAINENSATNKLKMAKDSKYTTVLIYNENDSFEQLKNDKELVDFYYFQKS